MFPGKPLKSRLLLLTLLAVLIFNFVLVHPVLAVGAPVLVTEDIPALRSDIKKDIGGALATAVMSSLQYFLNKIAYDTANWIASGRKSQSPMWWTKAGFRQVAEDATGEAIGVLGDNIEFLKKYGISLCVPPEPKFQLWLKLALAEEANPPVPRCNFKQIKDAWQRMNPMSGSFDPNAYRGIGLGFKPGQSELSTVLGASSAVTEISVWKAKEAKEEAELKGKIKPPETKVSGEATVPSATVEASAAALSPEEKKKQEEAQALTWTDVMYEGNWMSMIGNVGKLFVNTLAQKLGARLMKEGFLSVADLLKGGGGGVAVSPEEQFTPGGRQVAAAAFAEFLKTTPIEEESYEYLGELVAQGILDQNLADALKRPEPLTVAEAIEQGLLDGGRKLQSSCPDSSEPNPYCYEHLVKLRQWRILPIGWEIAAKLSTTQHYYTLQQAKDGFYKSDDPFYHLIDPNWALKAPVARCGAKVYGSTFLVEPSEAFAGERNEYCADVQNCLKEKEDGTCAENAWGYCLAEKNIWRLGADACEEQFNTCTTYTSTQGQSVSYLANTIDKGICSVDNVGCRAYALSSAWSNNQWQWKIATADSKIYFDKDVEQCDYSQEGCSGFVRTFDQNPLNLKKAPAYYNCYGESLVPASPAQVTDATMSSSSLKWAVNKADISKIFASWSAAQKEQCETSNKFTKVCSYDEVGCELYTPTEGGVSIPGILTENDRCPTECVGYESFKQQKTNFEMVAPVDFVYFIPSPVGTGLKPVPTACQSNYAGCDEFINLEAQAAGGEGKEYYTELRACSQDPAVGAVYYTWEGSDTAGYQLKSYNLKFGSPLGSPYDENKGQPPVYYNVETQNLASLLCDADKYKTRTADPGCREFYDKDGNKSYRLYLKTVTVSPDNCKKLRKSVSDESSCEPTGGKWDDEQKICIYFAIPAEGVTCPASANGCRDYKGNAGHNFQIVDSLGQNFESGTAGKDAKPLSGWDGKFSAESTVVGGKSLKVDQTTQTTTTLPKKDTTYLISFWAKGVGPGLKVEFYPSDDAGTPVGNGSEPAEVSLSSEWRNYTAGPFIVTWETPTTTLKFSSSPTANVFYLDNIVVKKMTADVFVIKDSWNTPSSCDNVLGDPYGKTQGGTDTNPYRLLPQAMLGCQEYKNRAGQPVTVKSFSQMCRQEAVGCEEFVDKFNTEKVEETTVNAYCQLSTAVANSPDRKNKTNQAQNCLDDKDNTLCTVLPNQDKCRFKFEGAQPAAKSGYAIDTDDETIVISADKKVYLVNDSKYYCADDNLGCQSLGPISYDKDGNATSTTSVHLKNQPDNYFQILCEKAAEGCDQFATTQGGVSYFKDPTVWGNKICEWKENAWGSYSGIGMLSSSVFSGTFTGWFKKGTTEPCYEPVSMIDPGYISGTTFGIWKTGDIDPIYIRYKGRVGECRAAQNGCAEFIDPMDTSPEHPAGEPYYVINNEKLDRASCGNQVSLKEGCVLFDETSRGMKTWNATSTYRSSEIDNYKKVNPVDCGVKGEKCPVSVCIASDGTTSVPTTLTDSSGNVIGYTCTAGILETANNSNLILKVKRDRVCGQWLACKSTMTVPDQDRPGAYKDICTELAVCDQANPVEDLLGRCGNWTRDSEITPPKNSRFIKDGYTSRDVSWWGKDYSGYSLPEAYMISDLEVDKGQLLGQNGQVVFLTDTQAIPQSCRGYASADAPTAYCSFTKVTYSAKGSQEQTQYFPYTKLLGGEGVCDSGWTANLYPKKGNSCQSSADCTDERPHARTAYPEDGVCLLDKDVSRARGWPGYCLDPSGQSQCNLWYPLSTPSGSVSLDNLFETAGYRPPEGSGKFWCVQAKGNSNREYQKTDGTWVYGEGYRFTTRPSGTYYFSPSPESGDSQGRRPAAAPPYFQYTMDSITNRYLGVTIKPIPAESSLHYSEIAAIGLDPTWSSPYWPTKELLIFPNRRLAGINSGGSAEQSGYYWSGPLKVSGNFLILDLIWRQGNDSKSEIGFDGLNYNRCWDVFTDQTSADTRRANRIWGFRVYFDKDTGLLKSFRAKVCSYASGMAISLNFYLTEVCTYIAQAVKEDENNPMGFSAKARTDNIWEDGGHLLGNSYGNPKLPYNQLFAPFGSFNQASDPVTATLSAYWANLESQGQKSDFEKTQALKLAGYRPIWMAPGGATPFTCAEENSGDCGNTYRCGGGPQANMSCNPLNTITILSTGATGHVYNTYYTDCYERIEDGQCLSAGNICEKDKKISCQADWQCQKNYGTCNTTTYRCILNADITCSSDNDCKKDLGFCQPVKKCQGGRSPDTVCTDDTYCLGDIVGHLCSDQGFIRGTCVGGQNHGLPCGSAQDCPSRRHSAAVEEVTENGICVGSSLDSGKAIRKSTVDEALNRLNELFVAGFGAWDWQSDGSYDYHPMGDVSMGYGSITPKPPKIYSLKTSTSYTPSGFTWGNANSFSIMKDDLPTTSLITASKSFPAALRFFAYADNDQMPITRLAVDWGDGSDPYVVKGWFKNRKPNCQGDMVCNDPSSNYYDLNRPCLTYVDCGGDYSLGCGTPTGSANRLHFGNSPSACDTGYYQFNHLYTCESSAGLLPCSYTAGKPTNAPCKSSTGDCVFLPKIQVLDNWGWCNAWLTTTPPADCANFGSDNGCWNDNPSKTEEDQKACYIGKSEPWTPFSSTIEVSP